MSELRQADDARVPASSNAVRAAGRSGLRQAVLVSVLVVVLFGFAGIVWYAYEQYRGSAGNGGTPLIRADVEPMRIRPDDPGGLEVPHRDRLVLQEPARAAIGEDGDGIVLPPPEEPMPRPAPMLGQRIASSELPVFAVQPGAGGSGTLEIAEALDAEGAEALIARDDTPPPDLITAPQWQEDPAPPPVVRDMAVGIIGGPLRSVPVAPTVLLARAEPMGHQRHGPAGRIEVAEGTIGVIRSRPRPATAPVPSETAEPVVVSAAASAPPQAAALPPAEAVSDSPPASRPEAPATAAAPRAPEQPPAVAEDPAAAPEDTAAASVPAPVPAERTYRVQLAAVNSDEAARTGWEGFKRSFPDLLGGLELFIQVVEVNGRTYHRIQGGRWTGTAPARSASSCGIAGPTALSALEGKSPLAVILGCGGPALSPHERRLFRQADPLGFILFRRNCRDPAQVARLVNDLREAVGREDAPILIDQEGGRVQRLRPPRWPEFPPMQRFGDLAARDADTAAEAARLNARAIAATLRGLGIDVNALPLLDLIVAGASEIIGDRAFSSDPAIVARLGESVCAGMLEEGVRPVMKHLPGHGRAPVDSHHALPVVEADRDLLEWEDFRPFRALAGDAWPVMPWAMTAHVVYTAFDAERPATLSDVVIKQVIRDYIGFRGVLLSDDLCMEALDGPPAARVTSALAAGCDIALHCNGDLAEMEAVAAAAPRLRPDSLERLRAGGRPKRPASPGDPEDLRTRVRDLMASA